MSDGEQQELNTLSGAYYRSLRDCPPGQWLRLGGQRGISPLCQRPSHMKPLLVTSRGNARQTEGCAARYPVARDVRRSRICPTCAIESPNLVWIHLDQKEVRSSSGA